MKIKAENESGSCEIEIHDHTSIDEVKDAMVTLMTWMGYQSETIKSLFEDE